MPDDSVPAAGGGQPPNGPLDGLTSGPIIPVEDDQFFDQTALSKFDRWSVDALKSRDEAYSSLLTCYKEYAEAVLKQNPERQETFFELSLFILIISPIQFIICLYFLWDSPNAVPLIASAVELLGAILVFPKIIAEYLFNTNETTSINSIVEAIQKYDIEIRRGIRHTVEASHKDSGDSDT